VGIDPQSEFGRLVLTCSLESPSKHSSTLAFSGLLVYDYFTVFVRVFLYSFTALLIWLSLLTGVPDREDSADFYCLLLGATLGMAFMASSVHLLMIFIAIEMASLPSYALAGFLKGRRQSGEAALNHALLDLLDGNCRLVDPKHTGGFAGRRTNSSRELRKIICRGKYFICFLPAFAKYCIIKFRYNIS